jgi:hypothetical protein
MKNSEQVRIILNDITDDFGKLRGSVELQLEKHIKRIYKNGQRSKKRR